MVSDLELSALRTNDVAYLGNAFPVEVTAQARGAEDIPLTLKLMTGSTTLATTMWVPQNALSSTQWTVQLDADKAGPDATFRLHRPTWRLAKNRGDAAQQHESSHG